MPNMLKKDDTTFIEKDKLDAPNLMSFEQTKDNRKKKHYSGICCGFMHTLAS